MIVKIKKTILFLWICCLPVHSVFSQAHSSKDNYTGIWESPLSWNPAWTVPQTANLSGYSVTVNGYITLNTSLSFSGNASNLIINDTLVIKGNLLLENNSKVTINDNGILIIRGNLLISNQTIITTNGYLIVAGNIIKNGSDHQGPFTSNDNPVKVFIGGTISPISLTDNNLYYPALNCTEPSTTPYPNSSCSYGNMTDLKSDPINTFFQYTCQTANVKANSSVCIANTIKLTSSIGTAYTWTGPNGFTSNSQNPVIPNATPGMAGIYTVTVIAAPGCSDTDTIDLTVNALPQTPVITSSGPLTFCSGDSVTLTSGAGTTYLWSNGATTPDINVDRSGSYTVRITDASGCMSSESADAVVKVNGLPITPAITAGGPTAFCAGDSVTLTSSPGSGYLWSNGAITQSINVSLSGNYTVKVTNATGCQSATSVATIVTVNALPATPVITAGGPIAFCTGGNVTLTSSAGNTYLWSTGATTSTVNVTTAGSYTVRVTNAYGCLSSPSAATVIIVNALPGMPTITAGGPVAFCAGGSVTLTASAGTSYLWSNSATTQSIIVTKTGTYTVKVTNASGCQSAASAATVVTVNALPVIPAIAAGGPTAFCTGGSVTLTSSAGTSYLWSNAATTQNINVTVAGSYSVQVTNASGCQSAPSVATIVTVNALPVPTISAGGPTTFCDGGSVTLNLTSVGGTGYLWSNGATTPDINVTSSGSYTLRVTNSSGCQSAPSVPIIVNVNALPVVNAGADATIPTGSFTTINATVTGTGPFTYSWSPAGQLADAAAVDPITVNLTTTTVFTLTATSTSTTCSSSDAVKITIGGGALSASATAAPGTVCAGENVRLDAVASGGSGPYTYTWTSIPVGFVSALANPVVNPTVNTTYYVTVSDGSSTVNSQVTATVNALPATPAITAAGLTTFCAGGSVNLTLTSGAATSYLWSNGATTPNINVTTSGSYSIQVTTASGCISAPSPAVAVTVNALPLTPVITAGGPTAFCPGGSVTLTSGTGSSYQWSNAASTPGINITTSGTYTVRVTNSSGCLSAPSVPTIITVNALPSPPAITASGPTAFCTGGSVTLTSGAGSAYLWSNGATTAGINVTASGSYTVRVTNAAGCLSSPSAATVVTVNALPGIPTITAGGPTTFCAGGSINLTASAGTSYLWSNSATTASINVTTGGTYTVRVTNASGCQSASSAATVVTVNNLPVIPTITAAGPTAFCAGGSISLTSSAGTSYLWSNAATTPGINATTAGSYTVQVTNASGCLSAASVATIVTINSLPTASITITDNSGTANNDGIICDGTSATLSASGGTYYLWSTGETTAVIRKGVAATYTVTVTNSNGCTDTEAVNLTVNAVPVTSALSNSPVCAENTIDLSSSGGKDYSWRGPEGFASDKQNPSIRFAYTAMTGDYIVTVTASNGCAATDTTNVTVNPLPSVNIRSNSPVCAGNIINLTSPNGTGYSYSWKGPDGFTSNLQNPSISNADSDMAGAYKLIVTALTGCTNENKTIVKVNAALLSTAGSNSPVCLGNTIDLTSSGGNSYSWSGPGGFTSSQQNPSISNAGTAISGEYTVMVTAATGCTATAATNVIIGEKPIADAGPDQVLNFLTEAEMNAVLSTSERGEWSLISGSGSISDIHSPTTKITELSEGENIFLWRVQNSSCEADAEVKITVYDPVIPSVITPNGDGLNDYFKIGEFNEQVVELIIFNQWGIEEYTNRKYSNNWDGRNNRGAELPNDTYFYILKFDNTKIKKGSVLIKR